MDRATGRILDDATTPGDDTFHVNAQAVNEPGNNALYYSGVGFLTVDGGSGTNTLNLFLNDVTPPGTTVWVGAGAVSRTPGSFLLFYRDTGGTFGGGLNIVLGISATTIVVQSQQAGVPTALYAQGAADVFNVAVTTSSAYQGLTLDAGGGPATVGVYDQSGGATGQLQALPDGTIEFDVTYADGSVSRIHEQNFQQPSLDTVLVTL